MAFDVRVYSNQGVKPTQVLETTVVSHSDVAVDKNFIIIKGLFASTLILNQTMFDLMMVIDRDNTPDYTPRTLSDAEKAYLEKQS